MGLVSTWLSGIGLSHAIPTFKAAGIVTPAALAELDLAHYEALGVKDPTDRRKLFYLVQRIKMAARDGDDDEEPDSAQETIDQVVSRTLNQTPMTSTKKSNKQQQQQKLILHEEDSLDEDDDDDYEDDDDDDDTDEMQNIPSTTTRQRTSKIRSNLSHSKKSRYSSINSESGVKENNTNNKQHVTSRTRSGHHHREENNNSSEIEESRGDESWGESSIADDELSSVGRPNRRINRRLEEKGLRVATESGSSTAEDDYYEDDTAEDSKPKIRRTCSSTSERPLSTTLGYRGDAETTTKRRMSSSTKSRHRNAASTSDRDADDESNHHPTSTKKTATSRKATTGMPAPRARRFESKLQNPTRTGKRLSTIPSEKVAPMSPLVDLSVTGMEEGIEKNGKRKNNNPAPWKLDIAYEDNDEDDKERSRSSRRGSISTSDSEREVSTARSRRRRSYKADADAAASESDTEVSRRRRSYKMESASESDTSVSRRHRSYKADSASESDASVSRRRRSYKAESASESDTNIQTKRRASDRRTSRSSTGIASSNNNNNRSRQSSSTGRAGRKSLLEDSSKPKSARGAVFVHGAAEDTSWFGQVSRLREENQNEHNLFGGNFEEQDDNEEMRIRVIVRKRPMSKSESKATKEVDVIHPLDYDGYGRILVYQPKTRVDLTREIETVPFAFDNVFDESSSNKAIYERTVRSIIPSVFEDGKWASVFAYGQTGSGKTFTMMGCNVTGIRAGTREENKANYGLYYMAALDVFKMAQMEEFCDTSIGVSLFEIYGGKLFDLLNRRKPVRCLEDQNGKVCFPGLSEHPVTCADEVMQVIEDGACNRSTGTTSKNADSSRSHAILQIHVRKPVGRKQNVEHGRLTFIDLAGSERGADTAKASRATRLEGAEINQSLLALKEVIRALATGDSMAHIPFRGSKLTQVLKESFVGENACSIMVACIAPNLSNCEHTLNTLRYADRVKERNAENGKLSASVVSHNRTRSSKRSKRYSLALENMSPEESEEEYEEDNPLESEDDIDVVSISDGKDDEEEVDESPIDLLLSPGAKELDQLLAETPEPQVRTTTRDQEARVDNLVATHRECMAEMLAMCKDEMTLANNADGNRDNIDVYLEDLGKIHERQCTMLVKLHEKLSEFRKMDQLAELREVDDVSEDDSFEDLRD